MAKPRLETLLARSEPFLILFWIDLNQETKIVLPLLMFSRKVNYLMEFRGKQKGRYVLFEKKSRIYRSFNSPPFFFLIHFVDHYHRGEAVHGLDTCVFYISRGVTLFLKSSLARG